MTLTELFLYFAFSYGATAILMFAQITAWIRNPLMKVNILKELFNCPMCLGFWVALFSTFLFLPTKSNLHLVLAVSSSGITWLLCSITDCALWVRAHYIGLYQETSSEDVKEIKAFCMKNKEEEELHG